MPDAPQVPQAAQARRAPEVRQAHQVHDPQVLRAISHPLRNRILSELNAGGSLRAADVSRLLDIPANQASFHLRQLAKYGLIEEDPDAGRDGRDRVWRAVHEAGLSFALDSFEQSPGGSAAAAVFRRNSASWGHVVVDAVYAAGHEAGQHYSLEETALRLTKSEAGALAAELSAVVERWRAERAGRAGPSTASAEDIDAEDVATYLYFGALLPYPDLRPGPA